MRTYPPKGLAHVVKEVRDLRNITGHTRRMFDQPRREGKLTKKFLGRRDADRRLGDLAKTPTISAPFTASWNHSPGHQTLAPCVSSEFCSALRTMKENWCTYSKREH
jgi:hypothetical protein